MPVGFLQFRADVDLLRALGLAFAKSIFGPFFVKRMQPYPSCEIIVPFLSGLYFIILPHLDLFLFDGGGDFLCQRHDRQDRRIAHGFRKDRGVRDVQVFRQQRAVQSLPFC